MKNKYKNVIQNLNKLKSILIVGNDSEIKNCVSCIKEESDEYVFDKNCEEITSVIVIKNLFGKTFYKIIYNNSNNYFCFWNIIFTFLRIYCKIGESDSKFRSILLTIFNGSNYFLSFCV